ncbi:MAG: thiamine pyrophosphate-dependent enzyme [Myxococcales bacterium]|nr:thiamine pyrophosphate-dependent enzyme [Myxococcales bacterium]
MDDAEGAPKLPQIPPIPEGMEQVYAYPKSLTENKMHYCPGCTHGTIHRMVAEVLDELGVRERTIGVAPVGCAVLAYNYFNVDIAEAAHGRAPAMATGIKRVSPEHIVFTYQGDGDLAAIGTGEIIHAASRGEKITTIFVNNAIYGMTGGQMAPTTLPDQVTSSCPTGRDVSTAGFPIAMSEMIALLPGAVYVTRQQALDAAGTRKTRKAIKLAFQAQLAGLGFSMVEVLATCNTNFHMKPLEAIRWAKENLEPYFEPGDKKVTDEVRALSRQRPGAPKGAGR